MNVADHRASLHRRILDPRAIRITAIALALSMAPVAVSSPSVAASSPTVSVTGLSMGARGNAVAALQEALIRHGIPVPGGADGIFGPATAAALRQFQSARGLTASGVVDEATTRALGLSPASTATSTAAPTARNVAASEFVGLSQGIVGPRVRMLQQALIAAGVPAVGGTDGVFGPMTASAVSRYQTANGLSASGVVDAATAARLTGSPLPAGSVEMPASSSNTPQAAAPAASPLSSLIGLGIGNMGTKVTQVQRALLAAGIRLPGGADGNFGPATASALNQFQSRNGLPVTGRVDEATALALATPTGAPVNSPAAPVSTPASRVTAGLAPGAVGGAVRALQEALLAAGFRVPGGADGIFGPATANAVKAFQTARGLPVSGRVDQATAAALAAPASAQPTTPTPAPTPAPSSPTVGFASFGERGDRVRALQQALISAGIAVPGGADGIFGSQTAGAIMNFQRQQGLPVTGTLDEPTAGRLGLTPAGAPVAPTTEQITLDVFPVQGRCHFGDTWHFPRGGGRKHEGVDIIAPEGKLIYAVTDGIVTHVYNDRPGSLAGNGLRLTQPDGTYFFYAHLSAFEEGISVGTRVRAGQVLGYNGSTGNAGTPHLHFEIHPKGGAAINPFPFVKAIDACSRTEPLAQS
jgi:peptidoglycan hydrolase-like protein with peptidoglycan-binding domain